MQLLGLWNYWVVIVLMMIGLYIVIARDNLVKKVMGLNIFQVSVIMFYVSMGKVDGGTAPILPEDEMVHDASHPVEHYTHGHLTDTRGWGSHEESLSEEEPAGHAPVHDPEEGPQLQAHDSSEVIYSNPLPHVLMLTAIVVGIATTAVALSLIIRIYEAYGTAEEDEIVEMETRAGVS